MNNCAEVFYFPYNTPTNQPNARTVEYEDVVDFTRWVHDRMKVSNFKLKNSFSYPINVFWYDESKNPILQQQMEPGEESFIGTHLGHIFVARRSSGEGDAEWTEADPIVDWLSVKDAGYEFGPHNRLETCDNYLPDPSRRFVSEEYDCNDMEKRFFEFCQQIWWEVRQGGNYFQPKVVHPVTHNGFYKRPLPAETYAWLRQWYEEQQRLQEAIETSAGPCMNQHESPTGITHLTPSLKDKLEDELRPILEEWYADGPLELTSIYGIRKYTNNAILRMHVDTVSTHVVSTIINVDQSVRKDWPLLILDHDGNEHNVTMAPGDMVLYESAKLLHGRPEPMDGDHYDNIFVHFKPVSGWDYDWV